jgi:flagella basal body P-ring formation protein FlgA
MTPMKIIFLFILLLLNSATALSAQDHASLKAAVSAFVEQQTANFPGRVSFNVDEIDQRIALKPCNKFEAYLPPGSQLMGRVSVGVRCLDANGWSIYIPVQIKLNRNLIISSRALSMGQIIHEEDIARLTSDINQAGLITDARLVIGKVLRYSVAAGYVLREDMLRAPYSVKQGQSVQLTVQGNGFKLSSSGVALNNAGEGETVQIRTTTGRNVSGIAVDEGVVKINP